MKGIKHVVLYSGGHSSALVAIEVVRKFGNENVILLNHNISSKVEHKDIKRFKNEIAEHLGLKITYANMKNYEEFDPLDICIKIKAFKVGTGTELCTNRLKTKPFHDWLKLNYLIKNNEISEEIILYYGFDKKETDRIERRTKILLKQGYRTEYPLANWGRTIYNIEDIGINRPVTYGLYRHANCIGCLKAGRQQWYMTYIMYNGYFEKAKLAERIIGYSIIKGVYLKDLEVKFKQMKEKGITPTEKIQPQTFWANVRKELNGD